LKASIRKTEEKKKKKSAYRRKRKKRGKRLSIPYLLLAGRKECLKGGHGRREKREGEKGKKPHLIFVREEKEGKKGGKNLVLLFPGK